jgi:hypothetical protein
MMRSSSVVSAFRNASSNAQVIRRDHVDLQQVRVLGAAPEKRMVGRARRAARDQAVSCDPAIVCGAWPILLCFVFGEQVGKPFSPCRFVRWRIGSAMFGLATETAGIIHIVEYDFPVAQGQVSDEVAA